MLSSVSCRTVCIKGVITVGAGVPELKGMDDEFCTGVCLPEEAAGEFIEAFELELVGFTEEVIESSGVSS